MSTIDILESTYSRPMNRLASGARSFTGWQLGALPKGDPQGDAVRDLLDRKVLTREEYLRIMAEEADHSSRAYALIARDTTAGWRP